MKSASSIVITRATLMFCLMTISENGYSESTSAKIETGLNCTMILILKLISYIQSIFTKTAKT